MPTLQLLAVAFILSSASALVLLYCLVRYHLDLLAAEKRIRRLQEANALLVDQLNASERTVTRLQEHLFHVRHPGVKGRGLWAAGCGQEEDSGSQPAARSSQPNGKWDWFIRGTGSGLNGN